MEKQIKTDYLRDAIEIISKAFAGKVDKAGEPYIGHLSRVAKSFVFGQIKIIALLHDLLEDCPEWSEDMLREKFSEYIVDAIVILTKNNKEEYQVYIDRIKTNQEATIIKLADLKDNMDLTRLPEITDIDLKRIKKYHKAYTELRIHAIEKCWIANYK